jgi:hypothetical protein
MSAGLEVLRAVKKTGQSGQANVSLATPLSSGQQP